MKALQEKTNWRFSNYIYITNDSKDKLIAYVVNDDLVKFSKPLQFDTRRRSFKEVKNVWENML